MLTWCQNVNIGDVMGGEGINYRQFHIIYKQCMKEMRLKEFNVEGKANRTITLH